MDSEEEVGSGNNSNDGAIEGRGHSNTWDFEEGEYRAPLLCAISNIARKTAHHVSHTCTTCLTANADFCCCNRSVPV